MFMRWKRRRLMQYDVDGRPQYSLYAVLVENQRVEGRSMQRVVKYLGYIAEIAIHHDEERERFWGRIAASLNDMALDPERRRMIEEKIAVMVPRPACSVA